jgi:Tol biopolymer transport system component
MKPKPRNALLLLVAAVVLTGASSAASVTTYRAAVYAVRADGGARHLVAEPDPPVAGFARSRGGRSILFNQVIDQTVALFAADVTGANAVRLTPPSMSAPYELAAFSPDGQTVAFSKLTLCGFRCAQYALYLVSRDGSNLRLVDEGGSNPSWSPDGSRLAYSGRNGIFVLTLADGDVRRIDPSGGGPIWAPRGERIAYGAVRDGYGVACFVNSDGSRRRCTHGHTLTSLVWSRDAKHVAFRQFFPRRIGIVDTEARHVRLLGFFGRLAQPAAFAPDSKRIAIWFGGYGSFGGPVLVVPVKHPPQARRLFGDDGSSLSDLRWRARGITYVASRPDTG